MLIRRYLRCIKFPGSRDIDNGFTPEPTIYTRFDAGGQPNQNNNHEKENTMLKKLIPTIALVAAVAPPRVRTERDLHQGHRADNEGELLRMSWCQFTDLQGIQEAGRKIHQRKGLVSFSKTKL
jgi:hypothetical protein